MEPKLKASFTELLGEYSKLQKSIRNLTRESLKQSGFFVSLYVIEYDMYTSWYTYDWSQTLQYVNYKSRKSNNRTTECVDCS